MNLEEMEATLKTDKKRLKEILDTPIDKRTSELKHEGGSLMFWNKLLEEDINELKMQQNKKNEYP